MVEEKHFDFNGEEIKETYDEWTRIWSPLSWSPIFKYT
jgi:hypothetical protein